MDCRATLLLLACFLTGAGCMSMDKNASNKPAPPPTPPPAPTVPERPLGVQPEPTLQHTVAKAKPGPKRKPQPATLVTMGQLREDQAKFTNDSTAQVKLRDEAREMYQQAIKIDPKCVEAHIGLARNYTRLRDYDRAIEAYENALKKFPKNGQIWHDLGMCHNSRKNWTDGIRCLNKAIEIEPENRKWAQALGLTYAMAGKIDDSLAVLSKGYGQAHAHYTVARTFRQMDQIEPCKQHLRLALQANPDLKSARDLLTALENPGAPQQAVAPQAPSAAPTAAASETPAELTATLELHPSQD